MESTQNPSGNDLVLQRVETRKAQMKRLVCVTERLIHFCVGVYLLHSLADRDLSLQILYKTPQFQSKLKGEKSFGNSFIEQ